MYKKKFIITAAGGNASIIEILETSLNKKGRIDRGKKLLTNYKAKNVEQVGFLNPAKNHLEMAGGEFCANAARSAAAIFYKINAKKKFEFTISGFKKNIQAQVKEISNNNYEITCRFPDLKIKMSPIYVLNKKAYLVDLKGIVHIVIDDKFPKKNYKTQYRKIVQELNLDSYGAIGVCWITCRYNKINLNPVVWVRNINSLFYESSCGSGSIAVAKVTNKNNISQVTGQKINVCFRARAIYVSSKIKITNEYKNN